MSPLHTPVALMTTLARMLQRSPRLGVHESGATDPFAGALETDHSGTSGDECPIRCGGTREHHGEAGVVDLSVGVLDGAHEGVRTKNGRSAQRVAPTQMTVASRSARPPERDAMKS